MSFIFSVWGTCRPRSPWSDVSRALPRETYQNREDGSHAQYDDYPGYDLVRVVMEVFVQQMLVEVLPGVRAHSLRVQSALSLLKFLQRLHGRMSLPVRYTNALCGSSDQCWPLVEGYSMVSAGRHLVAVSWVYLPQCCCLSTALHSTNYEHHEQCLLMVSSLKIVKFLLQ